MLSRGRFGESPRRSLGSSHLGSLEAGIKVTSRDPNDQVEEILRGSFDLHVHARPDPGDSLRMDALDTGRQAHEAEMAGFVLKSHYYPTAPLAQVLGRVYPGLRVAGSVVLNREVGGLNLDAVQAAADLGARVVWMPTLSADFHLSKQGRGPGLRLTGEGGDLLPRIRPMLETVRSHDMLLASGHVSPQESIALFRAAREMGIQRMVATHPAGVARIEELREMVSLGAHVEYAFLACTPSRNRATPAQIVEAVRSLGVEHCVVTTDFGQWMNPPPAEGMRMAIAELLNAGLTADEVSILVKTNPLELVGFQD